MTEKGREDDAFEHDDDLLNDDEFVLDLGDEEEATDGARRQPEQSNEDESLFVAGPSSTFEADGSAFEPQAEDLDFDTAADGKAEFDFNESDEVQFDEPGEIGFDEAGDFDSDGSVEAADDWKAGEPATTFDGDELLDVSGPDSFVLVDSTPTDQAPGQAEVDESDLLFSDERDGISVDSEFGADLGPTFGSENSFEMGDEAFHQAVGTEASDANGFGVDAADETLEVDMGFDDDDAGVPDLDAEWEAAASANAAAAAADDFFDSSSTDAFSNDFAPAPAAFSEDLAPAMAGSELDGDEWETEDGPAPEFDMDASGAQGDLWEEIPLGEAAAEDEFDPIYGDEGVVAAEGVGELAGDPYAHPADAEGAWSQETDSEQDYSEYEEAYADGTTQSTIGQVVGGIRPRHTLRWVAGLAALMPFVAAGVIAFAKPEWVERLFGNGPNKVSIAIVDRTEVERPTVSIERVQPPNVKFAGAVTPVVDPGAVDTPPTNIEVVSPIEVVATPVDGGSTENPPPVTVVDDGGAPDVTPPIDDPSPSRTDPDPGTVDPTRPDVAIDVPPEDPNRPDVAIDVSPEDSNQPAVGEGEEPTSGEDIETVPAEFYAAGADLLIARIPAIASGQSVNPTAGDLRPGKQAFARLENGSQFAGSVRRLEADTVTLALESGGEVTFRYDQVIELVNLADADYDEFASGSHRRGYVRLKNNARIFGSLHRDDGKGVVTLVEPNSVIAVPDWQILRFGYEASAGVEIVQDETDDDWLRQRVRQKIDEQR